MLELSHKQLQVYQAEKKRFYEISRSSLVEVDTQIEISLILGYLKMNEIKKLEEYLESVFKMLSKMVSNLGNKQPITYSLFPTCHSLFPTC